MLSKILRELSGGPRVGEVMTIPQALLARKGNGKTHTALVVQSGEAYKNAEDNKICTVTAENGRAHSAGATHNSKRWFSFRKCK